MTHLLKLEYSMGDDQPCDEQFCGKDGSSAMATDCSSHRISAMLCGSADNLIAGGSSGLTPSVLIRTTMKRNHNKYLL